MKLVGIHQPNFFPWLGYFQKILRSDVFVFLDHVQFQKTGGTWSNRVKMLSSSDGKWITAPINRSFHGVKSVCDVEFRQDDPWRERLLTFLSLNYGRAPYFSEVIDALTGFVLNPEQNMAKYNACAVIGIAGKLGIDPERFEWSSRLETEGHSNEMLISLVHSVGGDTYLSGGGAGGYQNDALFEAAGIRVLPQNFLHPVYEQVPGQAFVPGLSVVDALMYCGWARCRALLENSLHV